MDLKACTPDLQGRNIELLQLIERATNGGEALGVPAAELIAEKKALQAELRRRGHSIKAEARVSSVESRALSQHTTNMDADELLAENVELKKKLDAAGVK